ncbi:Plasmodium exported protein, unknown function [Plasmodium gonderi]|uniref:Variable surface protein n=1 Tax=Plasmodium gonderi TaxID=77519 RepID=A0A1Y1JSL5_PLAGO|nr:Plasmodium exported protein, unknown function [Plasmodium gonderi]GAW84438.1 Plasmodium exported protein, unknown function [Plasmodium gonderi]
MKINTYKMANVRVRQGLFEQSDASEHETKSTKLEEDALQKEFDEGSPTTSISEEQRSREDGREYTEVDNSRNEQVFHQDQHDKFLLGNEIVTLEEKPLAQLRQQTDTSKCPERALQPIYGAHHEETTELDARKNDPSRCNLEGKSCDLGTFQANYLNENYLQSELQDDNAVVPRKSFLQIRDNKGDSMSNDDRQLISAEPSSDAEHFIKTCSGKCDVHEPSNSVIPISDDRSKIQHFSINHNYYSTC